MTDIEVGSLWADIEKRVPNIKIIAITERNIFYENENGVGDCCGETYFLESYTPYTPPKEYKVWVYEARDGKSGHTFKKKKWGGADRAGMKLVAVRDIKEGDGL